MVLPNQGQSLSILTNLARPVLQLCVCITKVTPKCHSFWCFQLCYICVSYCLHRNLKAPRLQGHHILQLLEPMTGKPLYIKIHSFQFTQHKSDASNTLWSLLSRWRLSALHKGTLACLTVVGVEPVIQDSLQDTHDTFSMLDFMFMFDIVLSSDIFLH